MVIVYQWNRRYPADRYLDLDLSQWNLQEQTELAGTSHGNVTRKLYRRQTR